MSQLTQMRALRMILKGRRKFLIASLQTQMVLAQMEMVSNCAWFDDLAYAQLFKALVTNLVWVTDSKSQRTLDVFLLLVASKQQIVKM